MNKIILALGSNIQQKYHMRQAVALLCDTFKNMYFTEPCWTKPIGLDSEDFLNGMASAETNLSVEEVLAHLKSIEKSCGRTPQESKRGVIPMDIDLLMYAGQLFHEEDWERPYVRRLYEQLTGE